MLVLILTETLLSLCACAYCLLWAVGAVLFPQD